jgi:hypothetical protein
MPRHFPAPAIDENRYLFKQTRVGEADSGRQSGDEHGVPSAS